MIIGLPKEVKDGENRVGLTPGAVKALTRRSHRVLVEAGAGEGSFLTDEEYRAAGADIVPHAADAWAAELVVKVKEPLPSEYQYLRPGQILFTYLHLAANRELTQALLDSGITAIAYETVQTEDGKLPLLMPMSEVAGRMATQVGATYLEKHNGGRGILLGGVPGVAPASVVILGGGTVGTNAAKVALGMGAQVTVLDIHHERLQYLDDVFHGRLQTRASNEYNIEQAVFTADLVIGAVLIPGGRAPWLVTRKMLAHMRKGAVIVDVAVDQGGCIETSRPTTHSNPTFVVDDIVHYCVANMPGAVPRTSTFALVNQTMSYTLNLANQGLDAVRTSQALLHGLNTHRGHLTHKAVAETFGLPYTDPLQSLQT
ncbi:alanine dehydrogenase [Litorilinea aerophila]|uniref:Alanine dehydrogenase n=1 Tax=Litorilinea aerophila TaxID=1204385 RepID=A0A540VEJ1_9CHLR|nr:alanine dehydrogenase [Litorilinea aerophila]MCC9077077.1 alanine dehydrogenase [Litorilinea aerophila]OUC06846.1 alanine dehydrogenase [Litorilinea aerophila]